MAVDRFGHFAMFLQEADDHMFGLNRKLKVRAQHGDDRAQELHHQTVVARLKQAPVK